MKYIDSQKGIAPLVILFILAVVLAGVGGAYYLKQQQTKNISVSDETASWKTYKNEVYGYQIQYPATFDDDKKFHPVTGYFDRIDQANMLLVNYPTNPATIYVGAENSNETTCFETVYDNPVEIIERNGITYRRIIVSDGAAGTSYYTYRYSTMHNGLCYRIGLVIALSTVSDNRMDDIAIEDMKKETISVFDKIVDTFQFFK